MFNRPPRRKKDERWVVIMGLRRSLLLVMALVVAGGLGAVLLPEFDPFKLLLFLAICSALGEVFYRIDQRISQK